MDLETIAKKMWYAENPRIGLIYAIWLENELPKLLKEEEALKTLVGASAYEFYRINQKIKYDQYKSQIAIYLEMVKVITDI